MSLIAAVLPTAILLQTGCYAPTKHSYTFLGAFDTGITITAYTRGKNEFKELCTVVEDEMLKYHSFFDIYNDYNNVTNIKTINDNAGIAPVRVEKSIIDLLKFGIEMHKVSEGRLNIMLGAVLSIWHEHRTAGIADVNNATVPEKKALTDAAEHCDIDTLVIDEDESTVYISDAFASLDVGAIAKGFALELVMERLKTMGYDNVLINAGGNVGTIGSKPNGDAWSVAVRSPYDADENISIKELSGLAVATSGDYQRYYEVDGIRYNHIIDTQTLYPAKYVKSVTVGAPNTALADAMSTILFNMEPEDALECAEAADDMEVFIVAADGRILSSSGW